MKKSTKTTKQTTKTTTTTEPAAPPATRATVALNRRDLIEALTGEVNSEAAAEIDPAMAVPVRVLSHFADEVAALATLSEAGGPAIAAGLHVEMMFRISTRLQATSRILANLACSDAEGAA